VRSFFVLEAKVKLFIGARKMAQLRSQNVGEINSMMENKKKKKKKKEEVLSSKTFPALLSLSRSRQKDTKKA
jgi:hypothetical protein